MDYTYIIDTLEANRVIFQNLLQEQHEVAYRWRPYPEHWCLLEIVCHLYDEERDDFRLRLQTTLESPGIMPPPVDPVRWVKERNYLEQNYEMMLRDFLEERSKSIHWLRNLYAPQWENSYLHPKLGPTTARHFITNWLAHDHLHIRQITRLKYHYIKFLSGESLQYAGNW